MARIYAAPIKPPEVDYAKGYASWQKQEADYVEQVKTALLKRKPGDALVGKAVRFSVGDGYAVYLVASSKPLELVHLELGDAYRFLYANRLTLADIKKEIAYAEGMAKLFKSVKERAA